MELFVWYRLEKSEYLKNDNYLKKIKIMKLLKKKLFLWRRCKMFFLVDLDLVSIVLYFNVFLGFFFCENI